MNNPQKLVSFNKIFTGLFALAVPFSFLNIAELNMPKINQNNLPSRKIVVFEEGTTLAQRDVILGSLNDKRIKRMEKAGDIDVLENISNLDVSKLLKSDKVKTVEEDAIATTQAHNVTIQAQTLPWGIDRIDAELVWPGGNNANTMKVGIIDTGISSSHPDLQANIKGGINTIRPFKGWNDDNGHGSHVAGIIGALNNTSGVVGAAPQVDLYAIKVLNSAGSGYISDIIEGLDWAIANKMQIVNMSLGCNCPSVALSDAVKKVNQAGIVQVAAAGNSGSAVIYPAAYPEVIAVSATDSSNNIAGFSSRGPEVDIAAPGVSILSTYKGNNYATLSGTSMASPHVAGAAALLLNNPVDDSYDADNDGKWDPSEVLSKLQSTATDLGVTGMDDLYGAGLLNANLASQ